MGRYSRNLGEGSASIPHPMFTTYPLSSKHAVSLTFGGNSASVYKRDVLTSRPLITRLPVSASPILSATPAWSSSQLRVVARRCTTTTIEGTSGRGTRGPGPVRLSASSRLIVEQEHQANSVCSSSPLHSANQSSGHQNEKCALGWITTLAHNAAGTTQKIPRVKTTPIAVRLPASPMNRSVVIVWRPPWPQDLL